MKKYLKITLFGLVAALSLVAMPGIVSATGDLVGYWNLDDTGSQIVDSSGNTNDGTANGGVSSSTDVPPVSCLSDPRSLSFDGVGGSYVEVPDAASMDPSSQLTIAFWMKADAINSGNYQHMIFKNQGGGLTSYGVWYDWLGHVYFETNDGSVNGITSNAVVTPGTWHYIVADYNAVDQKIYIDGTLDNSTPLPGITIGYSGYPLKIGDGDFNLAFGGNLDDIRIYDRGLTDAEVADLAGGGCGPNVAPTASPSSGSGSSGAGGVPSSVASSPTVPSTATPHAPATGYGQTMSHSNLPIYMFVFGFTVITTQFGLFIQDRRARSRPPAS